MQKSILGLSQWESRVADVFSMARHSRMTSDNLIAHTDTWIHTELNRKHGKRAVYSLYVKGYVAGLLAAERARLYREFLEYCYCIDGVLYSTHKTSSHRLTEEFYTSGRGCELGQAPVHGHYWIGSDKPYFLGTKG